MELPAHVTSFGDELLALLAAAVGLPAVGRVWVLADGDDEREAQEYTNPKQAWKAIRRLESDEVLLVAPPIPAPVPGGEPWRDPAKSRLRWHQSTLIGIELVPVRPHLHAADHACPSPRPSAGHAPGRVAPVLAGQVGVRVGGGARADGAVRRPPGL